MTLKNKIKKFLKKYWYVLLIGISVLLIIITVFTRVADKTLFRKSLDFFNRNMRQLSKYNRKIDNEAFEELEKIEKRKKEIKKEIETRFKEETDSIKKKHKAQVKNELDELEGNEAALEAWYNNFLNS